MRFLSPTGWPRVIAGTIAVTLLCVGAALYVDSFNFPGLTPEQVDRAILTDILLPTALAGPLMFLLMNQMRKLAIAQRALQELAATDSLTAVLNRGAFTMLVEAYLDRAEKRADLRTGALLVIDADHFKAINDRFGHDRGDEALQLIARSIRGSLRDGDLVGRLGGEEFGVFLPGAKPVHSAAAAERIRAAVTEAEFAPDGTRWPLSVSIGGVSFAELSTFQALYRTADQCLYEAKRTGRNRATLREVAEQAIDAALPPRTMQPAA